MSSEETSENGAPDDTTDLEASRTALEAYQVPPKPKVDYKLFDKPNNKTTKLIDNSGTDVRLDSRRVWYSYKLKEEIFVFVIRVQVENFDSYHKFEFEWEDSEGGTHSSDVRVRDGNVDIFVNGLVSRFRFRPPPSIFVSREIIKVSVWGSSKEGLRDLLGDLYAIDKYKSRAIEAFDQAIEKKNEAEAELTSIEASISEANDKLQTAEKEEKEEQRRISAASEKVRSLEASLTSLETKKKDAEERLSRIDEEVSQKSKERKTISDDIVDKTKELSSLRENINIFPTTLVGFSDESASIIKRYSILAAIPILIIGAMFVLLVKGAADLTTIYKDDLSIDIWAITATRIPYVVIATAIVGACYKIARVFIEEIMRISQQKLNLNKISVIANDVSDVAETGLELDDKKAFELRSQLKMGLLRDHLKTYLTKDFFHKMPKSLGFGLEFSETKLSMAEASEKQKELESSDNIGEDHSLNDDDQVEAR